MYSLIVEPFEGQDGLWYARIKGTNGEELLRTSEGVHNKTDLTTMLTNTIRCFAQGQYTFEAA